jgi:hypothetical protein
LWKGIILRVIIDTGIGPDVCCSLVGYAKEDSSPQGPGPYYVYSFIILCDKSVENFYFLSKDDLNLQVKKYYNIHFIPSEKNKLTAGVVLCIEKAFHESTYGGKFYTYQFETSYGHIITRVLNNPVDYKVGNFYDVSFEEVELENNNPR